jgi:hypothetical protein
LMAAFWTMVIFMMSGSLFWMNVWKKRRGV